MEPGEILRHQRELMHQQSVENNSLLQDRAIVEQAVQTARKSLVDTVDYVIDGLHQRGVEPDVALYDKKYGGLFGGKIVSEKLVARGWVLWEAKGSRSDTPADSKSAGHVTYRDYEEGACLLESGGLATYNGLSPKAEPRQIYMDFFSNPRQTNYRSDEVFGHSGVYIPSSIDSRLRSAAIKDLGVESYSRHVRDEHIRECLFTQGWIRVMARIAMKHDIT